MLPPTYSIEQRADVVSALQAQIKKENVSGLHCRIVTNLTDMTRYRNGLRTGKRCTLSRTPFCCDFLRSSSFLAIVMFWRRYRSVSNNDCTITYVQQRELRRRRRFRIMNDSEL